MATPTELSVEAQLLQLEAARSLVLGDSSYYTQIVQGILPIIGANARIELRRWGADFLAETFASLDFKGDPKTSLALVVLQTLKEVLEIPGEDAGVVKSIIQTAASLYPLIFRHIIGNPNDKATWEKMTAIKSNILKRWDVAPSSVRICCIKFVQRVVHVQTPGPMPDPRRPEQTEISLAIVPRSHPLVPPPNLEAEASGLLDRLLDVFHQETSDAILINSTLNCLAILIRTRPSVSNRILNAVLNFSPLKQMTGPLTPKHKVIIKSMERTARALLINANKRNPTGPLAGRIQQYIERLMQSRIELFDESSRKRGPPIEPIDGVDNAKRARLGAQSSDGSDFPPLPPGPTSFAQLFTLTTDPGFTSFDVQQLPIDLVARIALPVLQSIDQRQLNRAVEAIRARHDTLSKSQQTLAPPISTFVGIDDDEDDYEPDYQPTEDVEQVLNKTDGFPPEDIQLPPEVALGPFKVPQPPPMDEEETSRVGRDTVTRVFSLMNRLEEPSTSKGHKPGLNRLAGSSYDRNAWITVITRLAARASAGLEFDDAGSKKSQGTNSVVNRIPSLSDTVRETLYLFILEDFRRRIDTAISWLNEEWLNDKIQQQQDPESATHNYDHWVLRVLDGMTPYLDAKDKVLIRFLSEIPTVNEAILGRVKGLARDPERVGLAVNSLHYLILLKPPARDICIDALEDLWRNYDDARGPAKKLLTKWRPHVLEEGNAMDGVKAEE
ncbi:MAG: hypothetical protein M1834_007757 [Cirrosporium novae-zelandiae]|nr:MAG: hypothetical protein M1834_007757 [Cirrosporium novae-zelandiae]